MATQEPNRGQHAELDDLLGQLKAAMAAANVTLALDLANDVIAWGEHRSDLNAVDRGRCNRAGALIALGRGEEIAAEQQMILMRSRDPANRFYAAYNLSLINDLRGNFKKSLFYGRLALENAEMLDGPDFLCPAHNQIANGLVAESYFAEAVDHYHHALGHLSDDQALTIAQVKANVGYCQLVLEQFAAGFSNLYASLRGFRRAGVPERERLSGVRLGLCYGHIETRHPQHARRHGQAALEAATACGDVDQIQKALYLLGETEKRMGNPMNAYSYFRQLQDEHHPDQPGLADMLMYAETHKLVNLLA